MRMCCCLAPTLAGAEISDSWMCLTVGAVACRLYILDKLNHTRPLVVGLSNVNKPRLSLLLFFLFFTGFILYRRREEGVATCHPSWFIPAMACVETCVLGSVFFPCQSFISTLSLLKSCIEVAEIRILTEKNRVGGTKPARTQSKHGEKCAEVHSAHPQGCFRLFYPSALFNVCHLRDSRGAAPVCLLARSPQIPPPAPACHSCCRASWDGMSEGAGMAAERGLACSGRHSWRA